MVPDGGSQVPLYGNEEPRNQSDLWAPEIPPSSDRRPPKSPVTGWSEGVSGLGGQGLEGVVREGAQQRLQSGQDAPQT